MTHYVLVNHIRAASPDETTIKDNEAVIELPQIVLHLA
jgi:hypothetical protein